MNEPGTFAISLLMINDWRIGTGTGIHGYVDRLVQRDTANGSGTQTAPIVPAKTLVGIWRDSCELAAHALDSGPVGVWHDWVTYLFGDQYKSVDGRALRPAALALDGPLRLPGRLPDLLSRTPQVAWATSFRKPGVALDPDTGTAKPDMLRFEEMARAGVTLCGSGRVEGFGALDAERRQVAYALLGAGAQLVERIGGKRRRGAGRCSMTLAGEGLGPEYTLPVIGEVPGPPSASPYPVAPHHVPVLDGVSTGWECVELVLTVRQPVMTAATVRGNVVEGANHIPGWCLMPEVARRLGGAAHALVRSGGLVVTSATPESTTGKRTLPVPRVFSHDKDDKHRAVQNTMVQPEKPHNTKPCREGFICPDGGPDIVIPGTTTLRMHNTVRDDVQRPTRDVGGVYIYRALDAGTVLRTEVRLRAGRLAAGWERKLAGRWRVGRSSKDDYGQIDVEVRPVSGASTPIGPAGDGVLRVWLLSDLLIRDERLRPSTAPADVARALHTALIKAGASHNLRLTPDISALGGNRTESWHRGWNLPRPTLYGMAAGSCLTFRVTKGTLTPAALAEVRKAGVGDRRAEGFGQVEFDHPLLLNPITTSSARATRKPIEKHTPALITPDEEGHTDARVFERAAWRTEIHRACESIAGDPRRRQDVIPPAVGSSQLNTLSEITRDLTPGRAESFLTWLTRPKAGRPDWPKNAVTSLRNLLLGPHRVWELLALPERELVVTGDGIEALRTELRAEAVRVLVDTCLTAHTRAVAAAHADERNAG
ncbi:RAMP superfamily CRISPR-associated protein [Sinosporangium siamense]|nr:RAMP superfamily CRISPR-associated protein [Sinosporangium siamense]